MKTHTGWLICFALLTLTGCGDGGNGVKMGTLPPEAVSKTFGEGGEKITTLDSGLKYQDIKPGTGTEAEDGKTVWVHYSGFLTDGTKFDSSFKRGEPISFQLGTGNVIKGWHQGIKGMKTGGKRKLLIPSSLAYGAGGRAPVIPPNADLVFDVELIKVD